MEKISIARIIRSKRKTLALEITQDTRLIVRASKSISNEYIEKIVHKKRFWIRNTQKAILEKNKRISPKEYVNGEGFLYLGNTYKLSIVDNSLEPLTFDNGFHFLKSCLPKAKETFIDWYKKEAYSKIKKRLDWYSESSGIEYKKMNITSAMKRWGSCNAEGGLSFSWRLIMTPLKVIDYVVAHELAHIVIRNHSEKFWTKVKMLIPDYKYSKNWLKDNGYSLNLK